MLHTHNTTLHRFSAYRNSTIRKHITKTYLALTGTTLAAVAGVMFSLHYQIHPYLSLFAIFAAIFAIFAIPEERKIERTGILLGLGFFQGVAISPLIAQVLIMDPRILATAFLSTTTIFVCFSLSAILSERRSWLYLGGFLSSCLSMLFWGSLFQMFFHSYFLFNIQLYLGLVMFIGYVIFDTQIMIERAASGSKDYVADALQLFIDFVGIFVRILILLSKDKKKK
jgi:FtsH-binding integral membrane protein